MQANKITYYGNTLIDLTNDTVTPDTLISGITAHAASGENITGALVVQKWYSGSTEPSANLGNNGDIYIKV